MGEARLKSAILGLNEEGLELLDAIDSVGQAGGFDIVAVADREVKLAENVAKRYDCAFFDDYRQLVVQNQLDVLFVAEPLHVCDEQVVAAMKKNFHIVKSGPPGLDFEQLAELSRQACKQKVRLITVNCSRFMPTLKLLFEYVQSEGVENFHLITAVCNLPKRPDNDSERWLNDPQLAGGGVLLRNAYEIIDQIVRNFGIPQQVYSLNTNVAPDKQQRLSITEDTVIAAMKFSDTLICNLIASRIIGPAYRGLRLYSKDKYLTVTETDFTVFDSLGEIIQQSNHTTSRADALVAMLENVALVLQSEDKNAIFADENTDLNNIAVIESAYLSAKTSMPEDPVRILEMVNAEPIRVWSSSAKRIV
jgi:predicted dehydrogenase